MAPYIIKEMGVIKNMQCVQKGWAEKDEWGLRRKTKVSVLQRKEYVGKERG